MSISKGFVPLVVWLEELLSDWRCGAFLINVPSIGGVILALCDIGGVSLFVVVVAGITLALLTTLPIDYPL